MGEDEEPTLGHRLEGHVRAELRLDDVADVGDHGVVPAHRPGLVVLVTTQHAGVHRVGADATHADAEMGVVEGEPLGESQRAVLGQRVRHVRRAGDQRRRRQRLHEVALAPLDHLRHDLLGGPHVGEQVDVDDGSDLLGRGAEVGTDVVDAGVGAEDTHRPELGDRTLHEVVNGVGLADVARDRQTTDVAGHLLGPRAVQVGDDHLGALPGEALGERPADAVPATGHDRALVAEVHQNRSPPAAAAVVPSRSKDLTTLRPIIQRCTSSGPSTRRCWRTSAYQAASGVSSV